MLRFLVLDAYPAEDRKALERVGGRLGGELYCEIFRELEPGCRVDLRMPADGELELPEGVDLADYDGVVWSGSTLSVHERDDVRVARTIALAERVYEVGVPSYGSCYAAQLAVVAAGGECERNPKGREFGVATDIRLSRNGARHPFFARRRSLQELGPGADFAVFESHQDIIVRLPQTAKVLASNELAPVQAVEVSSRRGTFWAVQYHPEWSFAELAAVLDVRMSKGAAAGDENREALTLARDEFLRLESVAGQGVRPGGELADELVRPELRWAEARSWLDAVVIPRAGR